MSSTSIKRIRKTLKLTQRAAAALVHVSPNTWARWERGEAKPRGLHQRRLINNLPQFIRNRKPRRAYSSVPPPVSANLEKMSRSTGATWLKFARTWAGNDAEDLLKEVYALRSEAEF